MMTRQKTVWLALLLIGLYTDFLNASEIMRWMIASSDSICWKVNGAHNDHIEMSGLKVSTVLRYGVNEAGEWVIDRNMVLPTFRTIPNDTHGSLQHHFNGGLGTFMSCKWPAVSRGKGGDCIVEWNYDCKEYICC